MKQNLKKTAIVATISLEKVREYSKNKENVLKP